MKNKPLNRLIAALSVLALPLMVRAQTSLDLNKGKINVEQWVARHFARQGELPFSFTYGGQPSSAFLKTWGYTVRRHVMPQTGATNVIYTYTAPDGSLQVSCDVKIYRAHKAVMWVLRRSLIHISEPTRQEATPYAVFCLKKKNNRSRRT